MSVMPTAPTAKRPRARSRAGRGGVYAALDLGTNNCRLLIARPAPGGFEIVDSFSRIVRLGEGLNASGRLGESAIERTIGALKLCADKMRRRRVTHSRAVATEACRRAQNGGDFVRRARAETGLEIEIIGQDEEARLAVTGCAALLDGQARHALIFDIGGGSTELAWLSREAPGLRARIADWTSVPMGVVTLAESYPADRVEPAQFARMTEAALEALAPFERRCRIGAAIAAGGVQMIGSSGTVTTLAGVHLGLARYDRARVDGTVIGFDALRAAGLRLAGLSCAARARLPTVGPGRADLVVAGAAILEAVMRLWPASRLCVADRGLREGILRSLMLLPCGTELSLAAR